MDDTRSSLIDTHTDGEGCGFTECLESTETGKSRRTHDSVNNVTQSEDNWDYEKHSQIILWWLS